ncbi:MAG: DUF4231 domain-containing protein [Lautropia sp.]|nr:DUF4231 domain-containing protein [Lautropia sp.]MCL4701859.1 DUF4231 domain-containing protein [Burkholderiaceae bacterium]MCZ2413918.1 DUF4231 domain-containing protein [Burkholderiales bacterium]MDL1907175.1 DUF4231 domain-containing protein [Betaproteobacteria bacterium PRO1]
MIDSQGGRQENQGTTPKSVAEHPAWHRLEDQLQWYDTKSTQCQRWYKRLKLVQISLAVLIPVLSHLDPMYAKWVTSVAGALIAVLEGVQHMNQYSTLWVTYRATAERLKHEKFLFLSAAGPYKGQPEPERLIALAERVEEHVSTEHANWFNETRRVVSAQKQEAK